MPDYDRDLQTIKEDIRARSDIVEVINQYTRLKRAGKNWTGLCPFHADKRPSFSVSPATQTYRCWSCGEKGDVFEFIEKKENLDFLEAMEMLANRAGIPFERRGSNREQTSEREQMFALNALAARYYQECLNRSAEAQDYLAKRAILKPTQEQWDLGFAPNEWEGLAFYLERQRADLALAAKLGLIRVRQPGGGHYDTFRNRLMFPIHDLQGRVVGFGGRAMGDDPAKYLNSEQSPLFDKSRTLYGLVFARKAISPTRPPVFVEGYVDVITAHQAGFAQCVATLGTSMTEEHARLLARYSPRVIICYDADTAGLKATKRGAEVWENIGVEGAEVRVARLPPGEDPDSLLRSGQTAEFQHALDNAVPRLDFEIEQTLLRHNMDTNEGRDQALSEIIPIVASIRSLTQRDRYVQKVAHLHPAYRFSLGRAIEALLADVEMYSRQSNGAQSPRDRGFPLTEQSNRGPLAHEPAPPAYRPPSSENWGRWEPDTRYVKRAGDGNGIGPAYTGDRTGREGTGRDGWKRQKGRRESRDPLRDYSPPSLQSPALTGVEKAERQLLRALFTADWRAYILGRLHPDLLISAEARETFGMVARTPARSDGSIDPALVFRQAEALDAAHAVERLALENLELENEGVHAPSVVALEAENSGEERNTRIAEIFLETPQEMREDAPNSLTTVPVRGDAALEAASAANVRAAYSPERGSNSAKSADFIRDLLEDSLSVMANEPLNEAVLADCIRRLQKYREEQALREMMERLGRDDLTPEQRQSTIQQYHEKMRQSRGSPPAVGENNG